MVSAYHLYYFGRLIFLLENAQNQYIHDQNGSHGVLYWIKMIIDVIRDCNLRVTAETLEPLARFAEEIDQRSPDSRLSYKEAATLETIVRTTSYTLEAELKTLVVFIPTDRRLDLKKLTGDVEQLFHYGIFETLPALAQYDLRQAARCIAFEVPTAAAFHLLRATECVLRSLSCNVTSASDSRARWYEIVKALGKSEELSDESALLQHLDYIRKKFRNPTQHPEKEYDIEEAQDLWALCTEVINRMGRLLDESAEDA